MPGGVDDSLIGPPASVAGDRIGLFGGSFNPAHDGHLHVSRCALDRLSLDAVWWLVSPQNPLKSSDDMAPFVDRIGSALAIAKANPRIAVTGLEQSLGTRQTIDTLTGIMSVFPDRQFVWMMGADNLVQMDRWASWREIFALMPIAVFARPGYAEDALISPAAKAFADARIAEEGLKSLPGHAPPAWAWVEIPPHPASATAIREGRAH